MLHHISGRLTHKTPTELVIEAGGIGYLINISLNTYDQLGSSESQTLLVVPIYREDNQTLYGFLKEEERQMFKLLISVSGVGANTARLILSAMNPTELANNILSENDAALKKIKGIGPKSAKRLVVELKDKVEKGFEGELNLNISQQGNSVIHEALSGLVVLGFDRAKSNKVLHALYSENKEYTVEQLIKEGIKKLH